MKRALLIAFHFPPVGFSSGVHRALKLVEDLPGAGWQPLVVAPSERAYPLLSSDQVDLIPPEAIVRRAFALDSVRHLGIGSRYLSWTALPDRWVTWWPAAVITALAVCRRYRPSLIWSTYPITTAHMVALAVHRLTGLPWIADFRDPMTKDAYPPSPGLRRLARAIEQRVVHRCTRAVFTTDGTLRLHATRYPDIPAERWRVISNGYDEEAFNAVEVDASDCTRAMPAGRRIRILHSGHVYPLERDPRALFAALATLRARGVVSPEDFELTLRASGHDEHHRALAEEAGVADLVSFTPPIAYSEALREMLGVDGLLLLQSPEFNEQIPAKAYEYLRAGRPMVALTDPRGDTAALLKRAGVQDVLPWADVDAIAEGFGSFVSRLRAGEVAPPPRDFALQHSRHQMSRRMIELFNEVADGAASS